MSCSVPSNISSIGSVISDNWMFGLFGSTSSLKCDALKGTRFYETSKYVQILFIKDRA